MLRERTDLQVKACVNAMELVSRVEGSTGTEIFVALEKELRTCGIKPPKLTPTKRTILLEAGFAKNVAKAVTMKAGRSTVVMEPTFQRVFPMIWRWVHPQDAEATAKFVPSIYSVPGVNAPMPTAM